jgi:hypothetical protein
MTVIQKLSVGVALAGIAVLPAPAQTVRPRIDNERVSIWEITTQAGKTIEIPSGNRQDTIRILLEQGPRLGETIYTRKGQGLPKNASKMPERSIVIALKEGAEVLPVPNRSGYPDAFPRPGVKKLFENDRATVWDYSWTPGMPTPMHFHSRDVAVLYLGDGDLRSTTPQGVVTLNPYGFGDTRFNKPNRTHYEEVVNGTQRAILTELK